MATVTLAPVVPGTGWAKTGTPITWTVADGTSDYQFFSTGREVLHYLVATGPVTLTVTSQPDSPAGRLGDFVQAVATGVEGMTQMFPRNGWANAAGYIKIAAPDTNFSFWVEQMPA
jgi:hypothetical protein